MLHEFENPQHPDYPQRQNCADDLRALVGRIHGVDDDRSVVRQQAQDINHVQRLPKEGDFLWREVEPSDELDGEEGRADVIQDCHGDVALRLLVLHVAVVAAAAGVPVAGVTGGAGADAGVGGGVCHAERRVRLQHKHADREQHEEHRHERVELKHKKMGGGVKFCLNSVIEVG